MAIKKGLKLLGSADSRLTEFWFGVQAFGTSILSLSFADSVNTATIVFLWLNAIFAVPQSLLAWSSFIKLRHWSNWLTSTFSLCISFSLIGNPGELVAVFGYGFLSLATIHCSFLTNRQLHKDDFYKNVSDG